MLVQRQQQMDETRARRAGDAVHIAILCFGHVGEANLKEPQSEPRIVVDQPAHPTTRDETNARRQEHFRRDLMIGMREQRTVADDLARPSQSHQG